MARSGNFLTISLHRSGTVLGDGKFLLLTITTTCGGNLLYFSDLEEVAEIRGKLLLTPIVTESADSYEVRHIVDYFKIYRIS